MSSHDWTVSLTSLSARILKSRLSWTSVLPRSCCDRKTKWLENGSWYGPNWLQCRNAEKSVRPRRSTCCMRNENFTKILQSHRGESATHEISVVRLQPRSCSFLPLHGRLFQRWRWYIFLRGSRCDIDFEKIRNVVGWRFDCFRNWKRKESENV